MTYNIALIPGDGVGFEVIAAAECILKKVSQKFTHDFKFEYALAGGAAIEKFGEPFPKSSLEICKKSDSILVGAIGDSRWENLARELRPERALLNIRKIFGLYANLRPAVIHKSLAELSPLRFEVTGGKPIDIMMVREATGGIYVGRHGKEQTAQGETAWDIEQYSYEEVKRISIMAFETAMCRRKKVTNIDKANVLESSRLWRSVAEEVSKNYKDVTLEHMYVDSAAMQLLCQPHNFDVVLTSNMFGDILSDETSQITGAVAMLPSANVNNTSFGMYEPMHGPMHTIANKDIANPIGAILSGAMMLRRSFKLNDEAQAIENAVTKTLEQGYRTEDIFTEHAQTQTKKIGTKEMGCIIAQNI